MELSISETHYQLLALNSYQILMLEMHEVSKKCILKSQKIKYVINILYLLGEIHY